jgi:hypothetical protein
VTRRARWVTLRARWVTRRARWVTRRARWVTLRARWVTLRGCPLTRVMLMFGGVHMCIQVLRTVVGFKADVAIIADEVGANLFKELDYHLEARNMAQFKRTHAFLGFVTTPTWLERFTGPKGTAQVLTMEFIHGSHIRDLAPPQQVGHANRSIARSHTRAPVGCRKTPLDGLRFSPSTHPLQVLGKGYITKGALDITNDPLDSAFVTGACAPHPRRLLSCESPMTRTRDTRRRRRWCRWRWRRQ